MKKSMLSIVIVSIILIVTTTYLITQTKLPYLLPSRGEEKVEIEYTSTCFQYDSYKKLPAGFHMALNNSELDYFEEEFGLDLSSEFEKYEEYKNDSFTYFIQVYNPVGKTNNIMPTNFNISMHKASFEYKSIYDLGLTSTCVVIPAKVAVAAVPVGSAGSGPADSSAGTAQQQGYIWSHCLQGSCAKTPCRPLLPSQENQSSDVPMLRCDVPKQSSPCRFRLMRPVEAVPMHRHRHRQRSPGRPYLPSGPCSSS